jgi:gluconolactonase
MRFALSFTVATLVATGFAQSPSPRDFKIIRLDPALDAIVAPDAQLETLGDRFGLTEGPVWVPDPAVPYLAFSDLTANVIYKRTPDGQLSVIAEDIVAANGITLDRQGRFVVCSPAARVVLRLERDGTRTILADRYEGKRLSGPNDVIVRSDGAIYFTDGNSGLRGGPARELDRNGVYLIKDGRVTLLEDNPDFPDAFPNGIALSEDERQLYVTFGQKIVRYEVRADGTVANRREFLDVPNNDGMKVDHRGNVFSTTGAGPGEVRITARDGRRLGTIQLPEIPGEPRRQVCATNVAFGDADAQGLYITACNPLFRVRLRAPGIRPGSAVTVNGLARDPAQFDGKVVTIRAPFSRGKNGEWIINDVFFRSILIVLPASPKSSPELSPTSAPQLAQLTQHAGRPGLLEATLTGRFEWSGVSCREGADCQGPFGKSRKTMRIVLQDVSDVSHKLVPRR